ncbi:MAG: NAD-dependent epimerase/dehydratase family protein [Candidatus Bilamarchaeaceae archaeon]
MIYLTGATGRLGRYVYNVFLSKKTEVFPIVRKPSGLKNEIISDFSEGSLKAILKNAKAIIHLAGSVKTYDKKELWNTNVELTRVIVNAAPKNAKIILASSISVYGKELAKKPADETTPISPDSDYARSKYEAEKLVSQHPNHVILRIGTIYGPFEDYKIMLQKIKRERMQIIGNGNNIIPFVHVEDAASVFIPALKKTGVYNIVGEAITQREAYAVAAKELGVKPPTKQVSFFLAYLSAWFAERAALLTGSECKITTEHIAILYFDRPFDCSKARRELGFLPRDPVNGIKQVVNELRPFII